MSIRRNTPCDCDGICPYDAQYGGDCEYWCGADEPADDYEQWGKSNFPLFARAASRLHKSSP